MSLVGAASSLHGFKLNKKKCVQSTWTKKLLNLQYPTQTRLLILDHKKIPKNIAKHEDPMVLIPKKSHKS